MGFNFKKIDMGSYVAAKVPMVSLQNDGRLRFSMEAIRRFSLSSFLWAIIYYDVECDALAIRFTKDWEAGAVKMPQNEVDDRSILIVKFLKHHDITYKREAAQGQSHRHCRVDLMPCNGMEGAYECQGLTAAGRRGVEEGFCVLSDSDEFMYECTEYYAPDEEYGLLWNDTDMGIDGSSRKYTISGKDAKNGLLKTMEDRLPAYKENS